MTTPSPTLSTSRHRAEAWLIGIARWQTPTGLVVGSIRIVSIRTTERIRYLLEVDPFERSVQVSGRPPELLALDTDDHGVGLWLLTAPCVLIQTRLDHGQRLVVDVLAVVTRNQHRAIVRAHQRTKAGLMHGLYALVIQPKRSQIDVGSRPLEGRESDGDQAD